jgi:hypothetical protein
LNYLKRSEGKFEIVWLVQLDLSSTETEGQSKVSVLERYQSVKLHTEVCLITYRDVSNNTQRCVMFTYLSCNLYTLSTPNTGRCVKLSFVSFGTQNIFIGAKVGWSYLWKLVAVPKRSLVSFYTRGVVYILCLVFNFYLKNA